MNVVRRHMRVGFAAWCLVAMLFGQVLFLPWQAGATGEVGRPPLPEGIVRLPFDGPTEITQVPGCGWHNRNNKNYETGYNVSPQSQEQNDRAFDFGLFDGTAVLAAGEGDVISTDVIGGALQVGIAHGRWENGAFVHNGVRSFYLHLQDFVDGAQVGDHVQVGQQVGWSGHSGGVPPHLHFDVTENNDDSDPASIGTAANINDLPGIPWDLNVLNADGYVTNCDLQVNETAVGGSIAQPPVAQNPDGSDEGSITVPIYDRDAAVNTAIATFGDGGQFGDDSASFVSQALWGGGLPQTDDWDQEVLSSPSSLVNYLINAHPIEGNASITPGTMTELSWSNDVPTGADLGDVIAYDYGGDGIIDHVALVTGFTNDGPTVTEHSPNHQDRYWTYSEEDGAWIAEAHPGAVAFLIHIAPLTLPNF